VGWPKKRLYRPSGHAVDLPRQALDSDADLWLPPKGHQQARFGGCDLSKRVTDPNDGLIVDIVGAWAAEKHERLRKYIDAAHGARAKYLRPRGSGGAAYVELFSGPGRSFVDDDKAFIDGSPLVAYKASKKSRANFSELHFNDLDPANIKALGHRIAKLGGAASFYNEAAETAIDKVIYALNPAGLHFAFLNPYNLQSLPFSQSWPVCRERTC
jgi:three-Cys-motif partner protein